MDITFINVGYGESILITAKDKAQEDGQFVMLIDGGSALDSEYEGESGRIRAFEFLQKKGITHIDLLVFSHVHEDHTSGLVPVLLNIPVKKLWTSICLSPDHCGEQIQPPVNLSVTNRKMLAAINDYSKMMKALPNQNVTRIDGIMTDFFCSGDLVIDVLGPEPEYRKKVEEAVGRVFAASSEQELYEALTTTTESINNASLVLRLRYKNFSTILCGDTNANGFRHIIESDPELLKADVFKLGHHGQADSVNEELIRAVDPSIVVCCASNDFRSGSSNEKTFETIQKASGKKTVTYLFQDGLYNAQWNTDIAPRNGVTLHFDEDGISWNIIDRQLFFRQL